MAYIAALGETMPDISLPDLTFPKLTFGKEQTPWDLRRWLYKGSARLNVKDVAAMIDSGILGSPLEARIEVVQQIHEVLLNFLDRGGSRATVVRALDMLTYWFRWADESEQEINLKFIEQSYRAWTDSLLHRVRIEKSLTDYSAYGYGSRVGWVLDQVLGRNIKLVSTTRLLRNRPGIYAVSPKAEKQNDEDTTALGHFLLDIADGLSTHAIWGPLPVRISLRNGKTLEEWSGPNRSRPQNLSISIPIPQAKYLARKSAEKRARWEAEKSYRTRYPLINLRIQAEMFMLMGQPAINLAQAYKLRMDQWRYKPSTHGYEVRTYKHRRLGPVVFEIYSQYREVFDRYLKWRAAIFPEDPDGLLFPLLDKGNVLSRRHEETAPAFYKLKDACKRAGVKYLPPGSLRNTNVNWMLRRTQDPDLTAAEKQHSTATLLKVYEKPSQQKAMVQIKAFWVKHDPSQAAVGPGSCLGEVPEAIAGIPSAATKPDCQTPAGCLFCTHQRDIDSLDHVWSLATYRHLKSFELSAQGPVESKKDLPKHPADLAIERLTAKLNYIRSSSARRSDWVEEALLRIEEERFHPAWMGMIASL